MIFDTHAHYTDARFDEDREELLAGMKARGVGEIVEVGASLRRMRSIWQKVTTIFMQRWAYTRRTSRA